MLRRLALRDFVIVRTLDLEFAPGFTALTGETGAGKSILVDALQLALGSRGDAGVVPEGSARAEIAAEFDAPAALRDWLAEAGFEADGRRSRAASAPRSQRRSRASASRTSTPRSSAWAGSTRRSPSRSTSRRSSRRRRGW